MLRLTFTEETLMSMLIRAKVCPAGYKIVKIKRSSTGESGGLVLELEEKNDK